MRRREEVDVEVKVLMTWNIRIDKDREYFEFLIKQFLPGMQRLGLQPTDAWFTAYGEGPQVLAAALVPSYEAARYILASQAWQHLEEKLRDYVTDYRYKIVPAREGFQL